MKVTFTQPDEFRAELAKDGPPSRILRVTRSYRPAGQLPVRTVQVVAAYVNARGELVELRSYVGDHWPGGPGDGLNARVREAGDRVIAEIEAACRELGIEARSGLFKEDAEP